MLLGHSQLLKEADPNSSAITFNRKSQVSSIETHEDMPSNTKPPQPDVVDLTQDDDDDDPMHGIPAHQPDQARIHNDPFANVEASGHMPDVSASSLLTYLNRGVGAGDRRGSRVASTSRTSGVRWVPWQMQESLSGQAHNDYYRRAITVPNQQAEAARARSGMSPPAANLQRQMRLFWHQAGYLA